MKNIAFAFLMTASSLYAVACSSPTTKVNSTENSAAATPAIAEGSTSVNDTTKSGKTIIVDVRTPEEWNNDGHANCTTLIPLNELESKMETLRGYDKIVFVCRSGGRAGRATELLKANGFKDVSNAGPWQNAPCK
jgi:rhodanese-related sulfurtransferase